MAKIKVTSEAILYKNRTKGFPLILQDDGKVHWLSLHYFFELLRSNKVGSIHTYAQHLQDFFSQLEVDGELENIDYVDDGYLVAYKSSLLNRNTNSKNYAVQVLRTVLHYCKWLEDNDFVKNLIGTEKHYRIRIKISDKGNIQHFLTKNKTTNKRATIAPRSEWIDFIKKQGPKNNELNERFELMVDWARSSGLRSFELCSLVISQLPNRETARRAIESGKNVYMLLTVTKGSQDKSIPVNPLLVKKTWDYIDGSRKKIIKKFKKKAGYNKYIEPTSIFLSDKTGFALSPASFSNSIRKAFLSAVKVNDLTEDERVWCHGLRHNFSVTLLKELDLKKVPRPEAIARQATRHGSVSAMEPYLTERFNEDFDG